MTESKLNIGAGGQIVPGWTNLDRAWPPDLVRYTDPVGNQIAVDNDAALVTHDLTNPLPFPDDHFRVAVAHHVLDMFFEEHLHALIAEIARVLEPGGVLRVSSPDYSHAVRAMVRNDAAWFENLGVPPTFHSMQDAFMWYFRWGGARLFPLVCPAHLGVEFLAPADLRWETVDYHETIAPTSTIVDLDSRQDESWFLEAVKS